MLRELLICAYRLYANIRSSVFCTFLKIFGNDLGKGVFVHWNSTIKSRIRIGNYSRINGTISISGDGKVIIGKYCAIGTYVTIITTNHGMNFANTQDTLQCRNKFKLTRENKTDVILGNNVWIGDNATILPGVVIDSGAVIGANSVVTRYVEPFTIVAGAPARLIRKRFTDDVADKLLKTSWWNWNEQKIKDNKEFFETDLTKVTPADIGKILKRSKTK